MISSKEGNWRGSISYHPVRLLDAVDALYTKYNMLLYENGYGSEHALGDTQMSIIEGVKKVRRMSDINRRRKLTKYKSDIQKLYKQHATPGSGETRENH